MEPLHPKSSGSRRIRSRHGGTSARLVLATGEGGDGFRLRRSVRFRGLRLDFPLKIRPAGPGDLAAYPKIVYVIQAPGGTGDASRSDGLARKFDAKGTGLFRQPRLALGHPR